MFVKFAIRVLDCILNTRFYEKKKSNRKKKNHNLFPKSLAYFEVQLLHAGHQGCSKPWVSVLFLDIIEILKSLFPVGHSKAMLPGLKFCCPFYVGLKNGFLPVWVFLN